MIIPIKSSSATLRACLESIRRQTYTNLEIVIVDSGRENGTGGIATEYGAKIFRKDCGMTTARNYGAKFAKGEYFFHMDSDMKLSKRVIEKCVEALQNGTYAAVVPQIYEGNGFLGECRALEFACLFDDDMIKSSRFISRFAFESVGGYDENLEAGEDWDITQKIGAWYRIARIDSYLVHGWGKYNLAKAMIKSYNYGKTVKPYMNKHSQYAKHQWGILRIKHLNYQKLKHDPLHAGGLLFIKLCEFVAGWFGMMVAEVKKLINVG